MKICFLLGGFYQNGGIGRVTSVLANRLVEDERIEITTIGYHNPNKPDIYDISPKIKQVYLMESYQSMAKFMLCGGEKKLRKLLVDEDADVAVACGALFYPIVVRACRGIKTKSICWEHSDPEGNSDHRGQKYARKYGIKRSDLNVVLTKRAQRVFVEKYGAKNTMQIYNPIDPCVLEAADNYKADAKRIISVGRLTYQKHFDAAVEVAGKVLTNHRDWHWEVFGQGEEKDQLEKRASELGIGSQMHFRGQVSDLYERYKDYSILVMTSRYEGFPMALLEGIGNALPLLSFDIPTGPDEIIEDGVNGFLIRAFDLNKMAEKLDFMICNFAARKRMSECSCRKAKKFSEEEIIKQWQKIFRSLVM